MALKRTFMIGVMLVCGMLSSAAWGQNDIPGTFFERTPESAQNLPLATPGMFDYDAQLFAPLEFTNGKNPDPNCGFNFSVDRSYISLPRGTQFNSATGQQTSNGSEFNWGTNYELGWFGEEDRGWNARFDNLTGSFFVNGEDVQAGNPLHVEQKFATFQLNRIYRQNLSHGGYFEPFFGGRYMNLSDNGTEDLDVPAVPAALLLLSLEFRVSVCDLGSRFATALLVFRRVLAITCVAVAGVSQPAVQSPQRITNSVTQQPTL